MQFTKIANYTRDMIKYIAVMDKVTQCKPQSSDYIIGCYFSNCEL